MLLPWARSHCYLVLLLSVELSPLLSASACVILLFCLFIVVKCDERIQHSICVGKWFGKCSICPGCWFLSLTWVPWTTWTAKCVCISVRERVICLTGVHLCLWWTRKTIYVCVCVFGFSVFTGTAWLDLWLACHHVCLKQKATVSQQMLISSLDVEVVAIGRLVSKVRPGNPTYLNSSEVAFRKPYITAI